MMHKSKIMPATSPLFCNPLPSKTQCFMTTLLRHTVFMGNVFWFNGFNRFTWFNMGTITKNDRCLIKTIKTENITCTHKHNMT